MAQPEQSPELPAGGDPTLGPDGLVFKIQLHLIEKDGEVVDEQTSLQFSDGLSPGVSPTVAETLESHLEQLRQSAIIRMNEVILSRCTAGPPIPSRTGNVPIKPGHGSAPASQQGDSSLGPSDLRLIGCVVAIGQHGILFQAGVETKLSKALTPMGRGTAAALIETAVESLLKNALFRISQASQKRLPKSTEQFRDDSAKALSSAKSEFDDFPTELPRPPKKSSN